MSMIIDGSNGATFPSGKVQPDASSPYVMKNRIINGAMQIWQRGTTYALTNSNAYGSADRWAFLQATTANGIANQTASGLAGFQYALKLGRNSGATTTGAVQMTQVLETNNSIDLAGQSITLSFWAKAGANYSATSSNFGVYIAYGTGTDQSSSTFISGGWTGQVALVNTTTAITTTWTKYTFTATVGSTATQVGVNLYYSPTGTAGADDNVYITGVQLEKGSTATSFDYRPYGTELQLCQRYFNLIDSGAVGVCVSTTAIQLTAAFPVQMRTAPSITATTMRITDYYVNDYTSTNPSVSAANTSTQGFRINASNFTGLTTGRAIALLSTGTSAAPIQSSAEL